MKRISLLLSSLILIFLTASGNIIWESSWKIYHPDRGPYETTFKRWNQTVINGHTYYSTYPDNNIKIRDDGNKVYQYLCDTQEEILIIDLDLQVNDTFTMYDGSEMIVTAVKDTIIIPCYFTEPDKNDTTVRKCLYLQNINDPEHTDIWVEGLGSLNYGLFPIGNGKSQRALYCYNNLFTFKEANMQNVVAKINSMNKVRNDFEEEFNVSLQDGVLYIDALVEMDGFGYKYIFAIEKNDTIQLFVDDTPAWGDSYRELEISAQLSGYDKESYTYQINVGIKTFEGYIKASVTDIDKDAKSLTLHRSGDALMAVFPTAQAGEAITLYDATGRAVVIQAVRQGATTATIDVATLPAGVYIARLNSGATAKVVL